MRHPTEKSKFDETNNLTVKNLEQSDSWTQCDWIG